MGLSLLTPDILKQAISSLTPEQLKALGLRRPATDEEAAAYDQSHAPKGAPADFAGPVFANPDGVKVSDDTDPGGEPTRLPEGVTLQRQNFTGKMALDTSSPAAADLASPHLQTIQAKFDPNQEYAKEETKSAAFDPNGDYQPATAATTSSTSQDKDKPVTHILPQAGDALEDQSKEAFHTLGRELGSAWDTITGIPGAVYHAAADPPTPEELKQLGLGKSTGAGRVANFLQRMTGMGQLSEAARFYKQYVDATPDQKRAMEEQMLSVAPEAIGTGAGAAVLPKLIEKAPAAVTAVRELPSKITKPVATAPVRFGARAAETAINQKLVPVKKLANLMTPADEAEALEVKVPGRDYGLEKPAPEPKAVYPGADQPEIPEVVQQARPIAKGGKPVVDPAEGLGKIPVKSAAAEAAEAGENLEGVTSPQTEGAGEHSEPGAAETPASLKETLAEVLNKKASPADLEKLLNESLGGKPLDKGTSLRSQVPGNAPAAPSLPEGFTPVKSSVLRGYKYDPATQQLESVTNSGQHYVHGEVSPEQFEKFEAADSKGKAWNTMRGSATPIAKGPMGKPVPIRRGAVSASPEGEMTPLQQKVNNLQDFIRQAPEKAAKTPAKEVTAKPTPAAATDDLTAQLHRSLDQVKAGKGGVLASATPADLLDRWGVDPESFTEGRSQTRGMSPQESAADLKKMTARYKKGEPVEPVMETRDKNNNIIEVDGRGRALAAHRAGIERIPVIVRRLQ